MNNTTMNAMVFAVMAVTAGLAADTKPLDAGSVDFAKSNGKLKRQLYCSGMNPKISSRNVNDYTKEFERLRFATTRTHDFALFEANQRVIDTHHIFPLFHLDESDPSNYYFTATDQLLADIRSHGQQVFYRLGTSIEHTKANAHTNTQPPRDNAKYARVLANIIRHYNSGWDGNGQKWGIKYWEIWNEPDFAPQCWCGSLPQFYEFFATVAKHLKAEFPELKIGGPAFAHFNNIESFLKYMSEHQVPIDFISWHGYNKPIEEFTTGVTTVREMLDKYGYKDTETIIDEWHYLGKGGWTSVGWNNDGVGDNDDIAHLKRQHSDDGVWGCNSAAYNTAMVTRFHDVPLDWSFYYGYGYDGTWGLWDSARQPHRNYYSMLFLGDIINDYPERVTAIYKRPVYILASKNNDGKAALLVSDFKGVAKRIKITLNGLDYPKTFTLRRIDAENKFKTEEITLDSGELVLEKPLSAPGASAVYLLTEK